MSFIKNFCKNHFLRIKNYKMLLANYGLREIWIFINHINRKKLIQSYVIKNSANSIPKYICFFTDIMFQIRISKNDYFNKYLLKPKIRKNRWEELAFTKSYILDSTHFLKFNFLDLIKFFKF